VPPRKRRYYTAEYKVEAAHRVIDTDRTIAEVARELGIDAGMLSTGSKTSGAGSPPPRSTGRNPWRRPNEPSYSDCAGRSPNWEEDNSFLVKGVPRTREAA
jgi:transposase